MKGNKPPSFRNIVQRQPTLKEPRMMEIVGKNPCQQYIQCWSCGEYHMCIYLPQRGEKVRTRNNVQKVVNIKDMGRNVLRIYEALDNKKVEF
jgi:hypothetical protein